ncbi:MAG: hypothetical protein P4L41_05900 [Flavipsychrobacter sp.]|nr:hypothetical protein [Flavipsychrobacter sp.]
MNKIDYPLTRKGRTDFESAYYKALTKTNEALINSSLSTFLFNGIPLNFETLVKLSFEELVNLSPRLIRHSNTFNKIITVKKKKVITNAFLDLFNYTGNQPKLANFFMNQKSLKIKSCCYCSIDYINSFVDFPDYASALEFINQADEYELQYIKDLKEPLAKKIIARRTVKKFLSVDDIPADKKIKNLIKRIPFENSHNHFTLDHLIPQKTHKFYSLCLYNLAPSCYACNAKFKNSIEFTIDKDLIFISPTSSNYSFLTDFEFKIRFSLSLDKISNTSDFLLTKNVRGNEKHVEKYLRMFKILGRYFNHKDQILKLIEKNKNYPNSKIKELSIDTGIPQIEIRKMIFGEDLYNREYDGYPLVKFRRDIARDIKIKGVL